MPSYCTPGIVSDVICGAGKNTAAKEPSGAEIVLLVVPLQVGLTDGTHQRIGTDTEPIWDWLH